MLVLKRAPLRSIRIDKTTRQHQGRAELPSGEYSLSYEKSGCWNQPDTVRNRAPLKVAVQCETVSVGRQILFPETMRVGAGKSKRARTGVPVLVIAWMQASGAPSNRWRVRLKGRS